MTDDWMNPACSASQKSLLMGMATSMLPSRRASVSSSFELNGTAFTVMPYCFSSVLTRAESDPSICPSWPWLENGSRSFRYPMVMVLPWLASQEDSGLVSADEPLLRVE